MVTANGITHPAPVIGRSWSAVENALERSIDLIGAVTTVSGKSSGTSEALDAYGAFLYRAAEFVEAVEKQARAVLPSYKVPKALDRMLSIQCNAIKHNNTHLTWVSADNGFLRVNGYQLRHIEGKSEVPVDRFHSKRPSYSFNLERRSLYAAMYLLGEHAGRAIIEVHGAAVPAGTKRSAALDRVLALGPVIYPGEEREDFPAIKLSGASLGISLYGGARMPLSGNVRITAVHSGDGFTRTFGLTKV
jgi:hypothetical protein